MRCYFHLVNGQEVLRDDEGIEIADLDHARAEALMAIEDLRQVDLSGGLAWKGWRLVVTDVAGVVLISIDLTAAV